MLLGDILSGQMDTTRLTLLLGGVVLIVVWRLSTPTLDPREPPLLKPKIPVVGHLINMIMKGNGFFAATVEETAPDISTLPILNGKTYLISSPTLINQLFKSRTLSFDPYLYAVLERMTGISAPGMALFKSHEFFSEWLRLIYSQLAGAPLLDLNISVVDFVYDRLNAIDERLETEDLFLWLRELLTCATTTALLGEDNPYNDPDVVDAYWTFENNFPLLYLNLFPKFTARKPHLARQKLIDVYLAYFQAAKHRQPSSSSYNTKIWSHAEAKGVSHLDMARLNVGAVHGALSNTIPTAYIFLMHIFSRPDLIMELREEVIKVVEDKRQGGRGGEVVVHIANLEKAVPLLVSCFKETQRLSSQGSINRVGDEDVILTDENKRQYLLKKNVPVQCSGGISHRNPKQWGDDALEFNPRRYYKTLTPPLPNITNADASTQNASTSADGSDAPGAAPSADSPWANRGAFFPFGGGKHLCPGRNFAQAENWGMLIALLLGFEITQPVPTTIGDSPSHTGISSSSSSSSSKEAPALGATLREPKYTIPPLTAGIGTPVAGSDLRAVISRRSGWEGVKWTVAA